METRSRTMIVLTGAMEFHRPDNHSPEPHVLSKTLLGDVPPTVIPVGGEFYVKGTRVKTIPEAMRLEKEIPPACADLPLFMTSSQTFEASIR